VSRLRRLVNEREKLGAVKASKKRLSAKALKKIDTRLVAIKPALEFVLADVRWCPTSGRHRGQAQRGDRHARCSARGRA